MVVRSLALIFFFISMLAYGQEFTVSGKIYDTENTPIAFANIVLSKENTLIISGATTLEDGVFILKNINQGAYFLEISYLGFKTFKMPLKVDKDLDLEAIKLEESTENLKGVTVVAKRPTVKRLVDRLVFNVENSTLSNHNVIDVLKYTPGVSVNDEKITIKNGTPTVYINDRKVHLSASEVLQLLEGTSANNIKSIEVITNPPAKYEAEGGAVLNIVTKKNIIYGYHGNIFGNYKQGSEFPKYSFGTSHFFKTEKFNTYLNYSISPKKDYRNNSEFINFIENDQIVSTWETDYGRIRKFSNQNINASIGYELDKNNIFGISTNMLIAPRKGTKTRIETFTEVYGANGVLDSTFNSNNRSVNEIFNMAFTLDYVHRFKKDGESLSVSLHHTNFDSSSFQNVDTHYFLPNDIASRDNKFQTFSSQLIKLYTSQIDYELPINDSAQFEAGAKVSNINSGSILKQYVFENDIKEEDDQNSDEFLYDETNYAAYTSYSNDWSHWSLKSGIRVEYTDIIGNSISTNQDNAQDYFKFFPSFHILKRLNDNNEIFFSYNKRIQRPKYNKLNPFKYYLSDNAFIAGDPNLKFQIDYFFTLGYTLNKKYTFELYYNYEKNPVRDFIFQDNDDKMIKYLYANINRSKYYGLQFSTFTKILPNWNISAVLDINKFEDQFFVIDSNNNNLLSLKKWIFYSQINNYFSFLRDKSLTADVAFLYYSPFVDGPTSYTGTTSLDINLRKTFFKDRASISVGVVDVFDTQKYSQTTKYLNQDMFAKNRLETRLLTFGFNYKFGNTKLQNNKKEIDSDERERLNSDSKMSR